MVGGRRENDEMLVRLCHDVHADSVSDRRGLARTKMESAVPCRSIGTIVEMYSDRVMQAMEMRRMALLDNAGQRQRQ